MKRWEDYLCKASADLQWIELCDRPHNAVTRVDNGYDEKISELERKIEELQAYVEAVSRENISCDIKELI